MSELEQYRPSRGFLTTLAVVIVAALALAGPAAAHHGQSTNDASQPGYWFCASFNVGGNCTATGYDDHMRGTPGVENMRGVNGNDYMEGNDGNDIMYGGNNRVPPATGTIPREELRGQDGADVLYAGCPGGCTQANQPDNLFGGNGNDQIRGINGKRDYVEGGAGQDTCYVDPSLDSWLGCEIVKFS